MEPSSKIPVGPGTIAGVVVTALQIAGGVVLLLLGKSAEEKQTGKELLTTGVPATSIATIGGRMLQAGAALLRSETPLPSDAEEEASGPPEIPAPALQSVPPAA